MTLLNNENEDNLNKAEINWDNLLNDIQQELGPSEITNNINPNQLENIPAHTEKTQEGTCIYCLKCTDVKLWYPQFPIDSYHIPIVHWIRVMIAPRMQHYRRCFICIMLYVMHNPMEFNLVDQILAEKLLHAVPDMLNNMPHLCIHENIAEPAPETPALAEGQIQETEEPSTNEETPRTPKDIRQIIADFNDNKEKENNG